MIKTWTKQLGGWVEPILGPWLDGLGDGQRLVKHPKLRPQLRRTMDAIAITMFPEGGAIPYSADDVAISDYMMDMLAKIDRTKGDLLCVLVLIYEFVFPLMYRKGLRFTNLSPAKRLALLEDLHESPIYPVRLLNTSLRMLMTFAYTADPRVLEEMGFFKIHRYPADDRVDIRSQLPWETPEEAAARQKLHPQTTSEAGVPLAIDPFLSDGVQPSEPVRVSTATEPTPQKTKKAKAAKASSKKSAPKANAATATKATATPSSETSAKTA